jgi:hypothetical protein
MTAGMVNFWNSTNHMPTVPINNVYSHLYKYISVKIERERYVDDHI